MTQRAKICKAKNRCNEARGREVARFLCFLDLSLSQWVHIERAGGKDRPAGRKSMVKRRATA